MAIVVAVLAGWLVAILIVLWRHGSTLRDLWVEPVLRRAILIFESDDWGPAEAVHAQRLQRLADILGRYKDSQGRHPVTTLGMVLAIPDQRRMQEQGNKLYRPLTIVDDRFDDMRSVIRRGVEKGVFSVQLHGMEHYWPPSLMAAAERDESVATWLKREFPRTEPPADSSPFPLANSLTVSPVAP